MLTIRRIFAIVGPLGCGVVFLSGLVTAAEQPPQRTLQATMRTFFQALATVFPLSLKPPVSRPIFLETAIRLAPASPIAAKAYDALYAFVLTEYQGLKYTCTKGPGIPRRPPPAAWRVVSWL